MLRRLKSDVDLKIPPKKEVLVYAPLTQLQREMYSALVDRSILGYLDKKNVRIAFIFLTLFRMKNLSLVLLRYNACIMTGQKKSFEESSHL